MLSQHLNMPSTDIKRYFEEELNAIHELRIGCLASWIGHFLQKQVERIKSAIDGLLVELEIV